LASARFDFGTLGWLVTRKIAVPANGIYALDFWSYNAFPEYNFYNGVWISTSDNNLASFVEVKQLFGENEISDSWKSDINLTNAEAVTVLVKNNGGTPLTGFELQLSHNGNLIVSETYTNTLGSLSQVEYTFIQTLNLSAAGDHQITVRVIATGDEDPNNDVITKTVTNTLCPVITTFP
jgi:hypothetical protein